MLIQTRQDIKVLVIGHSVVTRNMINTTLKNNPEINVVNMAANSMGILDKIKLYKPDVITVDADIPDKNECISKIMTYSPLPIVMVSKTIEQYRNIKAQLLRNNDLIAISRNLLNVEKDSLEKDLARNIYIAKENKHYQNKIHNLTKKIKESSVTNREICNRYSFSNKINIRNVVAIGASTGGPKALKDVIPLIPKDLPATYLIVQHMPPGFTKTFAERLNDISEIVVKEAEDKEILKAGTAYIAPGGLHMLVKLNSKSDELVINLSSMPPVNWLRPAANTLFNSLADTGLTNLLGVIMTGMGRDGCEGLTNMKTKNKAHIIAESEESCAIYGMPKAVIDQGIADKIVSSTEITNEIINYVGVYRNGFESIH